MKTLLFVLGFALNAQAAGFLQFDAKVDAFDQNTVTVIMKDNRKLRIAKSSLSKKQQDELKPNQTIQLNLSQEEISKSVVKSKK